MNAWKLTRLVKDELVVSSLAEIGRRLPGEVSFVAEEASFTPEKIETRSDRLGQVLVTLVNPKDEAVRAAGEQLYADLLAAGIEVLLDDRDERPGSKFADADLLGCPVQVVVGKKARDIGFVLDDSDVPHDPPPDEGIPRML